MFSLHKRSIRPAVESREQHLERELVRLRGQLAHLARVQLLGSIAGSIAHELSQPLTAILSNAQAALRLLPASQRGGGEIRECLVGIVQSDKRASGVLGRLRLMLCENQAAPVPLAINDVVRESVAILGCVVARQGVAPRLCLASHLPKIEGDRVALQQVMLNLIINACDAMAGQDAPRELTLSTHATDDGGVEVRVIDGGEGIPEHDLERIFLPYVTSKAEGTGLGLSICRSIVASHAGTLWASNVTRGAAFHMRLPPPVRHDALMSGEPQSGRTRGQVAPRSGPASSPSHVRDAP